MKIKLNKMFKFILRYSLFLIMLGGLIISCSKEESTIGKQQANELSDSQAIFSNIDCGDISCILNSVEEYEFYQTYDAATFYTGIALESVLSDNPTLKRQFLGLYNQSENNSIRDLCNNLPGLKAELNTHIEKFWAQLDAYSEWKRGIFHENLEQGFDFVDYFNVLINRLKEGEQLVVYSPLDQENVTDDSTILMGLDITLPNQDYALCFKNKSSLFFTQSEAANSLNHFLFVGINTLQGGEARHLTFIELKLSKWYHYGKVASLSNDPMSVTWITKYRWYSSWKAKEIVDLNSSGESDEFYYWGYRITAHVEFNEHDNAHFRISEKHWANDSWISRYIQ